MFNKLIIMMLLLASLASIRYSWSFQGEVWRVPLKQQTQISLRVVPDLGTRLIFPFILDDPMLKPPLNYKLTNVRDFEVARTLDPIIGQNVFLITADGRREAFGKLYISIAGYNLALNLVVSHNINDHISDIYFNLTSEDRAFLIESQVSRIRDNLQKNYESKIKARSRINSDETLAELLTHGVKKKNIKELRRGKKDSSADIFLDKFLYRKPHVYSLSFWVEHYRDKFNLSSMLVQGLDKYGGSYIIEGKLTCFDKGKNLDQCVFVSDNPLLIADNLKLVISLTNDNNEIFEISY